MAGADAVVPNQRAPKKAKRASPRSPNAPTSQMPAAASAGGDGGGGVGVDCGARDVVRGGEMEEPTPARGSATGGGGRWMHVPS